MLRSADLGKELDVLKKRYDTDTSTTSDVVKALCLIAKMLRDVRMNQVTIMEAQGVELKKKPPVDSSKKE